MNTRTERSYGLNGYVDIQLPSFPDLGTISDTAKEFKAKMITLGALNLYAAAICYAVASNATECHSCLRGEF